MYVDSDIKDSILLVFVFHPKNPLCDSSERQIVDIMDAEVVIPFESSLEVLYFDFNHAEFILSSSWSESMYFRCSFYVITRVSQFYLSL